MKIEYEYWPTPDMPDKRLQGASEALKRDVEDGKANYINLPFSRDHLSAAVSVKREMRQISNLVVCGMGGSSLGAKALLSLFGPAEGVRIHVLDTIEPAVVEDLFSTIRLEDTLFNVVTKSGRTLETLAMLNIILRRLEEGGLDLTSHLIITTTESEENGLYSWAVSRGIRTLPFPHGVEGRYSVLSSVGLFPALYMDCNAEDLLRGAEGIARGYFDGKNEALLFASRSVAAIEDGMSSHIFFTYAQAMRDLGEWFSQLWAESLGKDGKGQIPVTVVGPAAQHSQLQLYLDGPKNIAVTLVGTEEHEGQFTIKKTNSPGDHLAGKTLSEILNAEMKATGLAMSDRKAFNRAVMLEGLREREIGSLIMFLEMATAYSCYLLGVDPYTQPAVESAKEYAKRMLGI